MGFNFRKSIKIGPARINLSKSGVGYSIGAGGVRYTKSAKKRKITSSGGFIKGLLYLLGFAILLVLIVDYWKAIVVVAVVGALAFLGWGYHKKAKIVTPDVPNLTENIPEVTLNTGEEK